MTEPKVTILRTMKELGLEIQSNALWFTCPKCFDDPNVGKGSSVGVHWIRIPSGTHWTWSGDITNLDLSRSVNLEPGGACKAHFQIKEGKIFNPNW